MNPNSMSFLIAGCILAFVFLFTGPVYIEADYPRGFDEPMSLATLAVSGLIVFVLSFVFFWYTNDDGKKKKNHFVKRFLARLRNGVG